jgi:hypothetical protein
MRCVWVGGGDLCTAEFECVAHAGRPFIQHHMRVSPRDWLLTTPSHTAAIDITCGRHLRFSAQLTRRLAAADSSAAAAAALAGATPSATTTSAAAAAAEGDVLARCWTVAYGERGATVHFALPDRGEYTAVIRARVVSGMTASGRVGGAGGTAAAAAAAGRISRKEEMCLVYVVRCQKGLNEMIAARSASASASASASSVVTAPPLAPTPTPLSPSAAASASASASAASTALAPVKSPPIALIGYLQPTAPVDSIRDALSADFVLLSPPPRDGALRFTPPSAPPPPALISAAAAAGAAVGVGASVVGSTTGEVHTAASAVASASFYMQVLGPVDVSTLVLVNNNVRAPLPTTTQRCTSPHPPLHVHSFALFCVVLCCVVLCCVVLCCGVLCCVVLCCVVLWCGVRLDVAEVYSE